MRNTIDTTATARIIEQAERRAYRRGYSAGKRAATKRQAESNAARQRRFRARARKLATRKK